MAGDRLPFPGPRPEPLDFSSDEARRAALAARRLASELSLVRRGIDVGQDDLAASRFAGRFATWMHDRALDLVDELGRVITTLEDQADDIEAAAWSAQRRIEARDLEVEVWTVRHRRWRDGDPRQRTHA